MPVTFTVNGREVEVLVDPRRLLVDVLRDDLGLTGTHVGCEHGVCGACTVRLDGRTVRACLLFGVQVGGRVVETIEAFATDTDGLDAVQISLWEHHGLQCGFCTPGMVLTANELLEQLASPTEEEAREYLAGQYCRCTGYQSIIDAVLDVSRD